MKRSLSFYLQFVMEQYCSNREAGAESALFKKKLKLTGEQSKSIMNAWVSEKLFTNFVFRASSSSSVAVQKQKQDQKISEREPREK